MSETTRVYSSAPTVGARGWELCEAARWEEAGRLLGEVLQRVPEWLRLPPDVEHHFRQATLEQLRGVRAMLDYQIGAVSRAGQRRLGTRIAVE